MAIALWNGSLDQTKTGGDDRLAREVRLSVDGLRPGRYALTHRRVDLEHSNIARHWDALGGGDWPSSDEAWRSLRDRDRLEPLRDDETLTVGADGRASTVFDLPMPAVSLIELRAVD